MIRVVLADDQELFLESLRSVLEMRFDDIEVTAVARTGREAIQQTEKHMPDVVVLDVRMPDIDGIEATREITRRFADTKVLVLTTFENDDYARGALDAGALGFLIKNMPPEQFVSAIRSAATGNVQVSADMIERLLQGKRARANAHDRSFDGFDLLTDRERDVLRYIAGGMSNHEIAEAIHVVDQTVKNYVSVIYDKLGVHNRVEAMRIGWKCFPDLRDDE